jgi:integrase
VTPPREAVRAAAEQLGFQAADPPRPRFEDGEDSLDAAWSLVRAQYRPPQKSPGNTGLLFSGTGTQQAAKNLALVKGDALVFTTSRGKSQNRHNAARALRRAADAAGLNREGLQPVGLHDLRHSFGACALRTRS